MKQRIITAICAIAVFIPICYFSGTIVFPLAMGILSAVSVYEMTNCVGAKGFHSMTIPSYLVGFVLPVLPYFTEAYTLPLFLAVCVLYLIGLQTSTVFSRGKIDYTVTTAVFTGVFYIAVSFTCIVLLRETGKYLYLLAFIIPWVSDTFAYFCGRLFGKHKLIPEVSPKKTVEGSIGGIVFGALAFVLYGMLIHRFFNSDTSPQYEIMAAAGAVVSVISQIGDLTASMIKRRYQIKDYGTVFPGHGGVLDRFDSVMLTAPVLYVLTQIPELTGRLI